MVLQAPEAPPLWVTATAWIWVKALEASSTAPAGRWVISSTWLMKASNTRALAEIERMAAALRRQPDLAGDAHLAAARIGAHDAAGGDTAICAAQQLPKLGTFEAKAALASSICGPTRGSSS